MQVKVLHANAPTLREYWNEMVAYRALVFTFAWQEIKTIYAQTYLGLAWAVIRPLVTLLIFTVLFKGLLNVQTVSPYYLFAFTGMIAWNFFSNIATNASTAILQKQHLIRKMYFPKLTVLLAKVLVGGVEALISLAIVLVMMLLEGRLPGVQILSLPLFLLLNITCGLMIAVWMNALNIRFRDLNQIVPSIISIGIWFTPVFYPTTIIPPQYHFVLWFNPVAGVIEGYRFALLGEAFPEGQFFISMGATMLLTLAGIWYLTRVEDQMVDYA